MGLASMGIGGIPSAGGPHNNRRVDSMNVSSNIISGATAIGQVKDPQDVVGSEFKNKQINELTDMVKILLEEQRALKEKLDLQERKMKNPTNPQDSIDVNMMARKQREITKKASERTRS